MDPMELVDEELRESLAMFPSIEMTPETMRGMREMIALAADMFPNDPEIPAEEIRAEGLNGAPAVRALLYRPPQGLTGPRPAIIEIHGGGFVIGIPEMGRPTHQNWAKTLGCFVISVDYRLSPETTYPGPLEDCYAVLRWVYQNADALGIDSTKIGVSGTSAGGGLAAALALFARDYGEFPLAFQYLVCPMLDDRTCDREAGQHVGAFVWTNHQNRIGWRNMLGKEPGGTDISPYAAPARAPQLAGLPPTFIATASLDLFVTENLNYAGRLAEAGVPVELHLYSGAYHGFEIAADARITKDLARDGIEALRRFFLKK